MTSLAGDLYLLIAAYGLAVAVSYAGLPVLGHGAFVAVGAFGSFQLAQHGAPLGVAVVAAIAIAAAAGYAVGFGAARLDGGPLALATWTVAWLVYLALQLYPGLGGGSQGLTRPSPARLVSPSLGVTITLMPVVHVVVASVAAVLLAVALWRIPGTATGLDLAALRTGPALAESLGVPVQRRRRAVLALAAGVGALAGAGSAVLDGVVAPADFSPLLSLQLFVAVLVGGTATWWGPAVGVVVLVALPHLADGLARVLDLDAVRARSVVTAVLLVAVLASRATVARLVGRGGRLTTRRERSVESDTADTARAPMPQPVPDWTPLLELRGVVASYGAVRALDGVDLTVTAGEVHALVGPNGSGKSTALRVAAGAVAPDFGALLIGGVAAPRAPAQRVRCGVARTMQRTAMLGELDVRTQVAIGARVRERLAYAGVRELLQTPSARAAARRRADAVTAALAVTGLRDSAQLPTSRLDSAGQRMLQVARTVATGARALLLDEPAAGMAATERRNLGDVLRELAACGHGVLLVEHDMALVGRVADRVTVLDAGRVIATGTPAEIRADPGVARAYLGA